MIIQNYVNNKKLWCISQLYNNRINITKTNGIQTINIIPWEMKNKNML